MSLINKMLQDLDARGNARADGVPPEIKTVGGGERRLPVGRIVAITGGVLVALGAAAWFVFPLKGKTYDVQPAPVTRAVPAAPVTVAEVAPAPAAREEKPVEAPRATPVSEPAPEPTPVAPVAREPRKAAAPAGKKETVVAPEPAPPAKPHAAPAPALAGAAAEATSTSWAVASERARAEQARLDKRWKAEEARLAALPRSQRREAERRLREEQARAAARAKVEASWLAALKRKEAGGAVAGADTTPHAAAPIALATRGQGRVETESQGAENAYRRGLAALQDGRVSEAMASLQGALRINPRHEAARQTLVGLLIENNRGDEAMSQLQQALTLDPRQPALAMLLARLQIERGKSGIEALLRTLPYATGNGEYHAFLGGALQRQARFHEAAEQYHTALRTTPNNAVWWMGLGMALQGEKRNLEAADAFRQARALGTLPTDLQGFVERRLQQVAR
jgi:MSHA biogenesis protein MshN